MTAATVGLGNAYRSAFHDHRSYYFGYFPSPTNVTSIFSARFRASCVAVNLRTPPETAMTNLLLQLWKDEQGQDIAEYAVMLAVILVIVVGTVRLIGSKSNTVFSNVASTIQ